MDYLYESGKTILRVNGVDYLYFETSIVDTIEDEPVKVCRLESDGASFTACILSDEKLYDFSSCSVVDYDEIIFVRAREGEDQTDFRARLENLLNSMIFPVIQEYGERLDRLSVDQQSVVNQRVNTWRLSVLDKLVQLDQGTGITLKEFRGLIPPP